MNTKSIPAFSIERTEENAEEINDVANEWNKRVNEYFDFHWKNEYLIFNGTKFYVFHTALLPEITIEQFREYFKEKPTYTLPDGDVVSEGDEVWWFGKGTLNIISEYIIQQTNIYNNSIYSQCYSTREKCQKALNEYKLKLAAERYPKGTNFKSAATYYTFISSGIFEVYNNSEDDGNVIDSDAGCIYDASTNTWAEILPSEEKSEERKIKWYRCPFTFTYRCVTILANSKFEFNYKDELVLILNDSICIYIPLEFALRMNFEPIYEETPLESFIKKYNLPEEAVTELENLIKK